MAEAKKTSRKAQSTEANAKAENNTKRTTKKTEEAKTLKKAGKEAPKKLENIIEAEAIAEEIVIDEKELDANKSKLAKAGKRSAKALKEAEEKAFKQERKDKKEDQKEAPKKPPVIARSRLERRGKNFIKASELIDKSKNYTLKEALDLAIKTSPTKFDAAVELHIRLGVDPKQSDQNIRANLVLPAGTGKTTKVAVFGDTIGVTKAKAARADIAAGDEFLQELDKEKINFDVLIATPAVMPKLVKYAKLLGPRGLMPNPKSGTVTNDITKAVKEAKAGRVEYRADSAGIIHIAIGKVSFKTDKLFTNAEEIIKSIKANKPASIKGAYILSAFATTSMGPSIKITTTEL